MTKERNRDWEQQQFKTKIFFHKINIEFAWSFVKFLHAVKGLQNHNHLQPNIWHYAFLPYKYHFY